MSEPGKEIITIVPEVPASGSRNVFAWFVEIRCRPDLIEAVLEEVENAVGDVHGEVERMQELERLRLAVDAAGAECCHCHEEGESTAYARMLWGCVRGLGV